MNDEAILALSKRLLITHGPDIAQQIVVEILEGQLPPNKILKRANTVEERERRYQSRTIKASRSPKIEREFYGGDGKDRQDY